MRITTDAFISKAKLIHGDKYDYSKVAYTDSSTEVIIICKTHGEFLQRPDLHIGRKHGCPKCGGTAKRTEQEFIEKANLIHKNNYDYTLVSYKNNITPVRIICKDHGEFLQSPKKHLIGQGCPKCRYIKSAKSNSDSKEEFLAKAKLIHGDTYNYDKVIYKNNTESIIITCKRHGDFKQRPYSHLNGRGCTECGREKIGDSVRLSLTEFITRSKSIHNDKYDYSLVNYKHCEEKVIIICPKHGEFRQSPIIHLGGHGCPHCRSSSGEKKVKGILEELNIEYLQQKKFEGCRNIRLLAFDFFLPTLNTCIEFQGRQHYEPGYFGGMKEYKLIQIRDDIKRKFCKSNNMKLLEIKYTEEDIKGLIKKELNI